MSRIFKVSIMGPDGPETIAIKPCIKKFENFKDEIFIRLPALKNKNFKIFYHDHDGDKITIFNTLDFEIFYDLMIQKVFLVINQGGDDYPIYTPTTEEAARKIPASNATPAGPSVANGAGAVLHPGVICDQCEKEIVGYRYKCLQCRDYDLCMVCESKMSHKEHAMIRIPDSAEFCVGGSIGSRIAKRLRLRRENSSAKADDSPTDSKKHHHHHRRHSSGGRNAFTLYDVMSQVNQAFGKVPEAPATAEMGDRTSNAPPKTGGQSEASLHCKNAEKYAKASIDLLSTLAQNFTNMMDPFAAAFEAPAARPESTGAATASASASASAPPAPRPAARTEVTLENVAKKLATEAAKEPAQEQAKQPEEPIIQAPRIIQVTLGPEGFTVVTPTQTPPITTADAEQSASNSMDVDGPTSSSSEPREQQKEFSRDWTLVDVDDLAEEIRAASQAAVESVAQTIAETVADAPVQAPAHGGAIPKSVSFEKKDKPTPDYEELSRALRSHIEEFQQIFKPKEDLQSKKTQTPPESVAAASPAPSVSQPAVVVPHPDPRVNESLAAMTAMGFSNEGGWLTQLLESVKGDIPRALDLLQPQK